MDITAVGEILIGLTQSGTNGQGVPRFDANPGGAPANLAVAASRPAKKGVSLILVTLGPKGAFYRFRGQTGLVPGVPCTVGDTFFGAALSQLARLDSLDALAVPELERIVALANKAASITASRHGAIPAMPALEAVAADRRYLSAASALCGISHTDKDPDRNGSTGFPPRRSGR